MLYFWHLVGNKMLTLLSNVFTDLNLTDMETCYRVFRRERIQSIELEEDGSGSRWESRTTGGRTTRGRRSDCGVKYRVKPLRQVG